ncbi:MAG: ATP-binding protein [Spirochaetaceae bacterium]|nr:ATP-binding protein [Spirochaetaceae bacterium]
MKKPSRILQNIHKTLNQNLQYLIVFYILFMVLFLILTGGGLISMSLLQDDANRLIFIPMVVFSLYILILFAVNLIQLFQQRGSLGVGRIKQRMVGYFIIIVMLSTLPQMILAFRLTNASLDYWLDQNMTEVLVNSLDFNLDYYQQEMKNLERTSLSDIFNDRDLSRPEKAMDIWNQISQLNGRIDTLQVILPLGGTWLLGDELARVPVTSELQNYRGFLSRRDLEEYSILSYQFFTQGPEEPYSVILSSLYPRKFNQLGRDLSRLLEKQNSYLNYRKEGWLNILIRLMIFLLPLLMLSINMGFALSERVVDPLDRLEKAMGRVSSGDFGYRLSEGFSPDLSHIVGSFNQMINELELSRVKEEQSGRVGAWRDLAQQLAHEIRNPLTPIKLSAQRVLKKTCDSDEEQTMIQAAMERIINEVNGLDHLLKEFRDFAGQKAPQLKPLELNVFLQNIMEQYQQDYPEVVFFLDSEGPLWAQADAIQFTQVMKNLLDNALAAMDKQGKISLGVYHLPRGTIDYGRIILQDSGPGIPEDIRGRIFKPYFTTRNEGTGLGLSIVERIINDHRGRIWLVSTNEGTTFTMDIPLGGKDETNTDY